MTTDLPDYTKEITVSVTIPGAVAEVPGTGVGTLPDITPGNATTRLTTDSIPCKAVLVRALTANSGKIRVGDSNTGAARGAEMGAGDTYVFSVENVNLLYVYGTGTDKVSVSYVK
jgi:hypothetical protein